MAMPKIKLNIREKDLGMGHILREAAKIRKKPFVNVGVVQAKGSRFHTNPKTGKQIMTVADIAQFHEYGAPDVGIPERSFIRSTVNHNQSRYDSHIAQLKDQIFDANSEMTTERALGLIGQEVSRDIKNTIRNNEAGLDGPTPLKPATIRAKNEAAIGAAAAKVRGYEGKAKLSRKDKEGLFNAQETVDTGGSSTPLIDTSQLVNSISYELVMEGQGSSTYSGEGPKTF